MKRREIAESVISGRKSGAEMVRLATVSCLSLPAGVIAASSLLPNSPSERVSR